jgi:predicted dehydrogenase
MRFALLGGHPDGRALALALVDSGRHDLVAYTASAGEEELRRTAPAARRVSDPEEILADPAVEAVVVAARLADRAALLRRALQSERHALCVYPSDRSPESAYEAAMIRDDTGYVLLPLLPDAVHPGVRRLAEFVGRGKDGEPPSPLGEFRLLEAEWSSAGEVLGGLEDPGGKVTFPGWDVLRALGGEVAEVSAFAAAEDAAAGEPVLLAGRFERGGLFQATLLPGRPDEPRWRLRVTGARGRAELLFPLGRDGPAFLSWPGGAGEVKEVYFERFDPWPLLVGAFESAVARQAALPPPPPGGRGPESPPEVAVARPEGIRTAEGLPPPPPRADAVQAAAPAGGAGAPWPTWQDAVRGLELDDAARRSLQRRRTSLLEYPEATEEVGFKGTMTLVGCGMVWVVLLLLILSTWVPWLRWLIVPLLVGFLALQLLRYLIPGRK